MQDGEEISWKSRSECWRWNRKAAWEQDRRTGSVGAWGSLCTSHPFTHMGTLPPHRAYTPVQAHTHPHGHTLTHTGTHLHGHTSTRAQSLTWAHTHMDTRTWAHGPPHGHLVPHAGTYVPVPHVNLLHPHPEPPLPCASPIWSLPVACGGTEASAGPAL